MKKRGLLLFLVIFFASAFISISHSDEEGYGAYYSFPYPVSQLEVLGYGSIAFAFIILAMLLFSKSMNETAKKITYITLIAIVSIVTLYLILTTLHLNSISETKGPVHWHADYEIWACDKEIKIASPKGFLSNKQGTSLLHSHVDNRIHVEGVLIDKRGASLGAFFAAIGGSLSDDGFEVPTDEGVVEVHAGDLCSGVPGNLYVFVNGKPIDDPSGHIIAPHEKVPPGDRIKIEFTSKTIDMIDPNIK